MPGPGDRAVVDVLIIGAGASGGVVAATSRKRGSRSCASSRATGPTEPTFRGADDRLGAASREAVDVVARTVRAAPRPTTRSTCARSRPRHRELQRRRRRHRALQRGSGRACCRPTSGSAPSTASRDDWPFGYADLLPYYERDRPRLRGLRPRRQPRVPAGRGPAAAAAADRRSRACCSPAPTRGSGGTGGRSPTRSRSVDVRRPSPVCAARHVLVGVQRGRQGIHRSDALAASVRRRRPLVTGARVRRIVVDGRGLAPRRRVGRPSGREHFQAAARRAVRGQRRRHRAVAAAVGDRAVTRRPRQLVGAGRAATSCSTRRARVAGLLRREHSRAGRASSGALIQSPRVLRHRPADAASSAARSGALGPDRRAARRGAPARSQPRAGREHTTRSSRAVRARRRSG